MGLEKKFAAESEMLSLSLSLELLSEPLVLYRTLLSLEQQQNSGYSPDNYPHAYYQESSEHIELVCDDEGGELSFLRVTQFYCFAFDSPLMTFYSLILRLLRVPIDRQATIPELKQ